MLIDGAPPERALAAVCEIAAAAAQRAMRLFQTRLAVRQKADGTPVTQADLDVHQHICGALSSCSRLPALSEEAAPPPFRERGKWPRYWLIDPIDGTREFIGGRPEFTVNIALIEGHAPVLGVIHAPATGACYYAARGLGAHERDRARPPRRLETRRAQAAGLRVACSRSRRNRRLNAFLRGLGTGTRIEPMGSSLKVCRVAAGRADIYPQFGKTCEWDTAAAQCILEQAGGLLVDFRLRPLRYNTQPSLENPGFLALGDPGFPWPARLQEAGLRPPAASAHAPEQRQAEDR